MVVQHNMSAANTNRQLGITTNAQAKSTEKLSSGYRINRAGDDAAGLTISEKMRSQVRGLDTASSNAQNGISAIQIAEGALTEIHSILQRMNELATQAANDTNTSKGTDGIQAKAGEAERKKQGFSNILYSDAYNHEEEDFSDRKQIQHEIDQLTSEINRIQSTTQFNSMDLLTGKFKNRRLQVGALDGQVISLSIRKMTASALLYGESATPVAGKKNIYTYKMGTLSVSTNKKAGSAMTRIQTAIARVSLQRSELGAVQNRLEHTISNLDTMSENTSAAESRIRDTDMAKEMVNYSKNNILAQAGQSMLAQANQSTQGVLSILG